MGNEDLPGNWENDVRIDINLRHTRISDFSSAQVEKRAPMRFGKRAPMRFGKRAPMRFGKRDLTEEMDEMKYLRSARAPMRFGKRVYQFTKKAPMRFGKRAPMRFGKREIGERMTGEDDGLYDAAYDYFY